MKRCPQCDFIYEDFDCLCDMDGTALVHDAHALSDGSEVHSWSRSRTWAFLVAVVAGSFMAGMSLYELNARSSRWKRVEVSVANPAKKKRALNSSNALQITPAVDKRRSLRSSASLNPAPKEPEAIRFEPLWRSQSSVFHPTAIQAGSDGSSSLKGYSQP